MTLLWSGLSVGAIYALVAVGYNVVFVSSGAFNFANAQLIMLGTFVAYWGLAILHLNPVVVMFLAAAIVGLAAVVEERVAIRTTRTIESQLITTVGVATLINGISALIWGGEPLGVPFFGSSNVGTLLGGRIFADTVWLIGVAVVLTFVLFAFTRKTLVGIALLAVSEDREAASVRGINVRALAIGAFALSGIIAGGLGVVIGPHTDAVATLGTSLALYGFVALAMGGFGSLPGGLIGGMAVGLIEVFSARYLGSQYGDIMVFATLLAVLLIRPAGLFGTFRERMV
jgi:branched-chain amino acid transport system permease protein